MFFPGALPQEFSKFISSIFPELHQPSDTGRLVTTRTLTFQVTDSCNLACTYCYQINKGHRRMSFDVAKQVIDDLLSGSEKYKTFADEKLTPGIIIEFIGGEPLLEIDLIDQITDYFRESAIALNHPYSERYSISICSNGLLYFTEKVQKYIRKNNLHLSFNVTVDGTKSLHDSCRLTPDGKPSYDIAASAAKHYREHYGFMGSKITIAPENVKFLSECLKTMKESGCYEINFNPVYEDVWKPEHARIYYDQLREFIFWFIEQDDWQNYAIRFLSSEDCTPLEPDDNRNWCGGTGNMLAVDPDGKLYPCLRYMESSLGKERAPLTCGTIECGCYCTEEDKELWNTLESITRRSQNNDKCFYCPIARGCGWCSAYNYQVTGTPNKRVVTICDMHKSRACASALLKAVSLKKLGVREKFKLCIPRDWAIEIIGSENYDELISLLEETGCDYEKRDYCEIQGH